MRLKDIKLFNANKELKDNIGTMHFNDAYDLIKTHKTTIELSKTTGETKSDTIQKN